MTTFTQPLDLLQLAAELETAGIPVPQGLGTAGDTVFTYTPDGTRQALPPAAQAVVTAHVSESDAQAARDTSDLDDFKGTWGQAAQALGWNATTHAWNAAAGQWDGLTPAQRTTFMRRMLATVRALARQR